METIRTKKEEADSNYTALTFLSAFNKSSVEDIAFLLLNAHQLANQMFRFCTMIRREPSVPSYLSFVKEFISNPHLIIYTISGVSIALITLCIVLLLIPSYIWFLRMRKNTIKSLTMIPSTTVSELYRSLKHADSNSAKAKAGRGGEDEGRKEGTSKRRNSHHRRNSNTNNAKNNNNAYSSNKGQVVSEIGGRKSFSKLRHKYLLDVWILLLFPITLVIIGLVILILASNYFTNSSVVRS